MSKRENDRLLNAIKTRSQKRTEFGRGIITADKHVANVQECIGLSACYRFMALKRTQTSFNDVLVKAANTLVYSNDDMVVKEQSSDSMEGIELPKNTLMVFRHVLTSTRKDRDGDVLRSGGADVDPKMLLLWQHVHTLPIGKMLKVYNQSDDNLELISTIVDINELSHDAAVIVDNDMARFSHGFRALEFEELKAEETDTTGPGGYDVKKFEIMEESIVSVPSNVDADMQEVMLSLVEGGKLTSPLMKQIGEGIRLHRNTTVQATAVEEDKEKENQIDESQPAEAGRTERPTGASEEADEQTAEEEGQGEERGAGDEEVKSGPLEGSWEDTERKLRSRAKPYLSAMGVDVCERDMVWLVGTFSDYVIVCIEKPEGGVLDEFRYFKVSWQMQNGGPVFVGDPQPVEIQHTVQNLSRSPLYYPKKYASYTDEERDTLIKRNVKALCGGLKDYEFERLTETQLQKAGRAISKANENLIQEAQESCVEVAGMDVPRAAKVMMREAARDLTKVLDSLAPLESDTKPTFKEAMSVMLTDASDEEQTTMLKTLQVILKGRERSQAVDNFRSALTGT